TVYYLTRKAYHGFHDLYVFLTRDMDEIDWAAKRTAEASKRFVYEEGCKKCHTNLFPTTLDALGAESHLKYVRDPENNSCVKCHLDVGHYRGEPVLATEQTEISDMELYTEPASVTTFENFTEKIPGTVVSFRMKAIPGGRFLMGSPPDESYRKADEGPVREVEVSGFWMAETEVTWNEYFAFFNATSSQGRKESETADEETDGITGATPPWGAPDQGWGTGDRPAITMTHHAAQTYCRWLSSVTGKKYRLPTEAEWEYAARGGTEGPYFFEGSPKKYESEGFRNKIFGADTSVINSYIIYQENSPNRTQPPTSVQPNPFGLKNMLGNVAEFCLDYYDPQVYAKYPKGIIKNPRGPREGLEHVIRGGSFKHTAKDLRIARRDFTRTQQWLETDPQIPKSIWWYSDCNHVGFRVVCENEPDETTR
ncbi:MAG: SUMF1/EgtB/PvdO family nonheme iron enzyme, partial [Mariniphaga sp.]|nr:SUMF1/EgtB/PvdO family nonheme iron enzyme [Mariniphaga sp.]